MTPAAETTTTCPACLTAMQPHAFAKQYTGSTTVDLCFSCRAIWFDRGESGSLAAEAVLQLFKLTHARPESGSSRWREVLRCPRCTDPLVLTQDLQRTTRFRYHRCTHDHGRLIGFAEFLREKGFVRDLSGAEITQLKTQVRQIACSSCGAPIDLATQTACAWCHSPVTFVDPAAIGKALDTWQAKTAVGRGAARTVGPDEARIDALMRALAPPKGTASTRPVEEISVVHDLLTVGIDMVMGLWTNLADN